MSTASHELILRWPQRCSRFNHGWLRNRFCQSLRVAIRIADGEVERDELETDHQAWVQAWLDNEDDASRLIEDYVGEMSPAVLFSVAPLSALDPRDAQYFSQLATSLWLKRYRIEERIERAKVDLATTSRLVRELGKAKDLRTAVESGVVASVHAACQRLADSLGQLPKSIAL